MKSEREGFNVIGKNLRKVEVEEKATGDCKFANDIYLPNMLYCKILRSPHAHALIKSIRTEKAESLPGVKAVITHKDASRLAMRSLPILPSVMIRDNQIIEKEVRYVGDRVAAVAAITSEIAEEALQLIEVDYEELPAVYDPHEAMNPDAPPVHRTIIRGEKEIKVKNNIAESVHWDLGGLEEGFKEADLILENTFKTQCQHNTPLGGPITVCKPLPRGRLEVWTHTQSINHTRANLAASLGISPSKIKVHRTFLGGAFGHYIHATFLDAICGFLTLKTGLPVRLEEDHEELFLSGGRHPMHMKLKIGAKKDGTLSAMHMRVVDNSGAYALAGSVISYATGMAFMSMYQCPNMAFDSKIVYTNTFPKGVMRGVGNEIQNFAVEQHMDMLAEGLDMDPLEIRLKNHSKKGDMFYYARRRVDIPFLIQSCGTEQIIREGSEKIGWGKEKSSVPNKDKPWIKRGIGMARAHHVSGIGGIIPSKAMLDGFGAQVLMNEDGTAKLLVGFGDAGSGGLTTAAAIVAEELGISLEDVIVVDIDTDTSLPEAGTHGSVGAYGQGLTVKAASTSAKNEMIKWASEIFEVPAEAVDVAGGRAYIKTNPSIGMGISTLLETVHQRGGCTIMGNAIMRVLQPPPSFCVVFVEIEVNTITGDVKVLKAISGLDVGTPLNLQSVRGQQIGGLHMGLGMALREEVLIDPSNGQILNPSFRDYKLLTPMDMPQVETFLADVYEPTGPFGAKGCGEVVNNPVAAAVANAVYNAVGVRTFKVPMTPETILEALNKD